MRRVVHNSGAGRIGMTWNIASGRIGIEREKRDADRCNEVHGTIVSRMRKKERKWT